LGALGCGTPRAGPHDPACSPLRAPLAPADLARLCQRVADELTTTFASHYSDQISLTQALEVETLQRYARQATGEKFLLQPQL
jgi:hypothetical protein